MMNDITRMMAQNDQKRLLGAAQDRAGASQSGLAALGNAWGDSQPSGGKWGQTIESLTGGNIRGELGGITGKQAGIGAGVGLGALALAYGLKRRKQKKENKSRMAERSKISDAAAQGQYLQGSPGNYGNSGNF